MVPHTTFSMQTLGHLTWLTPIFLTPNCSESFLSTHGHYELSCHLVIYAGIFDIVSLNVIRL